MAETPTTAKQEKPAESSPKAGQQTVLIPQKYIYLGLIGVLVAVAILVTLIILAVKNPVHTETARDIAIIALAAESGLIGLAMLVLVLQVARLTNMLEFEIKPILKSTADTVSTVRGTADFMSEHVVSPVIKASGFASGLTRLLGAISSLFPGRNSSPQGPQSDDSRLLLLENDQR